MIIKIFLAIVALSPLPLGSNRPLPWSVMGVLFGLVLIFWAVSSIYQQAEPKIKIINIWQPFFFYTLTIIWIILQTIPIFPNSYVHPLWGIAGKALQVNLDATISVDPFKTGTALARLLTYGGVFFLSLQLCRSVRHARFLFKTISFSGAFYASYGLFIYFGGYDTIIWYKKWTFGHNLSSTFVNRNSFATYIGLTILCSIALLTDVMSQKTFIGIRGNRKYRLMLERLADYGWYYLLCIFIGLTALFLSHSRAGLFSFFSGATMLLVLLALRKNMGTKALIGFSPALVVIFLLTFYVSGEQTMKRVLTSKTSTENRLLYNKQSLRGIKSEPILGFGYGSYSEVARMYRDESLVSSTRTVLSAHNTYLENIFELGFPAATALFISIGWLGYICFRGTFRRHRDTIYPAVGFGAFVLVAVHSTVDFSLEIPAIAVTFASIMGAASAQSWSSSDF